MPDTYFTQQQVSRHVLTRQGIGATVASGLDEFASPLQTDLKNVGKREGIATLKR